MYSLQTLRKKASKVGFSIHKGFSRLHNGTIADDCGERETGYNIVDKSTSELVWGCDNGYRDHIWQLEDIESFLKNHYDNIGLDF